VEATARQAGAREGADEATTTTKVRKVTAIIGTEVVVSEEALGKVKEIVVNDHGCIEYLIVADGEEYVAVPWGAVRYEAGARSITVTTTVTREKLRAVRFRSSAWPDFASDRWTRGAAGVWGEKALRRPQRDGGRDGGRGDGTREDSGKRKGDVKDRPKGDTPRDDATPKDGDTPKDGVRDKPKRDTRDKPKGDVRDKPKDDLRDKPKDDPRRDDAPKGRDDNRKDDKRPPVRRPPQPDQP